ncbi:MAG: hypothetical protein AB7F89_10335 [Pirellulaceae bacterium]
MTRCVALLSGGLDSMLAVRTMQKHGIEVEALNFQTIFTCCQDQAGRAARELGVRLTVLSQEDDYLDLIKYPRFGYGKGANPCIDCRIYMFRRARRFMEQVGAQFLVSGEVLGQRPKSQKRRDLEIIAFHSQVEELLLRPLSARLLPVTLPEQKGWVDRERLFAFRGRGRKELIRLAHEYGFASIPAPSTGCALTEPRFSRKVHDLIELDPDSTRWDFELLKLGRHFRYDAHTKVIVGRRESENDRLKYQFELPEARQVTMLWPYSFAGPRVLLIGARNEGSLQFALALVLRFSKRLASDEAVVCVEDRDGSQLVTFDPSRMPMADQAAHARTLATIEDV